MQVPVNDLVIVVDGAIRSAPADGIVGCSSHVRGAAEGSCAGGAGERQGEVVAVAGVGSSSARLRGAEEGELVAVVMEMTDRATWDRGERLDCGVVRAALQFDRTHQAAVRPGVEPAVDQAEQPLGIAGDVRAQPSGFGEVARIERESAHPEPTDRP